MLPSCSVTQGFLQKAQKSSAEHEFKGRAKRQATLKCGWTSKCGWMLSGVGETGAGWGLVLRPVFMAREPFECVHQPNCPQQSQSGQKQGCPMSSCSCLGSFHDSQGAAASQERAQGVSFSRKPLLPCEAAKGPLLGPCFRF